jgi:hypothetical protein
MSSSPLLDQCCWCTEVDLKFYVKTVCIDFMSAFRKVRIGGSIMSYEWLGEAFDCLGAHHENHMFLKTRERQDKRCASFTMSTTWRGKMLQMHRWSQMVKWSPDRILQILCHILWVSKCSNFGRVYLHVDSVFQFLKVRIIFRGLPRDCAQRITLGKKRMLYTGGSKLKIQKVSTPRGSHLMTAWISWVAPRCTPW